jgi:hypothetical protein
LEEAFKSGVRTFLFSIPTIPPAWCIRRGIASIAELANHFATIIADQLYSRLL